MARDEPPLLDLGQWTPGELQATANIFSGTGADDGLPDRVRILAQVAKLVRRRDAEAGADKDPDAPAIFLLEPTPSDSTRSRTQRAPMLNNGLTRLTGRIWFVSAAVSSGLYMDLPTQDDDAIVRLITDELGLGGTLAVFYDPRPTVPQLRLYPNGLRNLNECEIVDSHGADVTSARIFETIERVYQTCLKTPDAQSVAGKLWKKSSKWWPQKRAEIIVQLNLKAGLAGQFLTCTIRDEQPSPAGRVDLEIEQADPHARGKFIRHALIELKVLRSFRESGAVFPPAETLEWIESGVAQASVYGKEKGARMLSVCCFDMRTEDSKEACFDHVRKMAESLDVILRRWYLYSSSRLFRKASLSN